MATLKGQALLSAITKKYIKDVPAFAAGDTVKVAVSIKEG